MTYKKKTLKKLQSKWNRLPPNKEATALANIEWAVCHKCLEVSTWTGTQEQIQAQETVIRFSQVLNTRINTEGGIVGRASNMAKLEFPSLTWDTWNMGFMRMNAGSLNFIAVRLMMALIS